jgi:hypothetical protein
MTKLSWNHNQTDVTAVIAPTGVPVFKLWGMGVWGQCPHAGGTPLHPFKNPIGLLYSRQKLKSDRPQTKRAIAALGKRENSDTAVIRLT